MDTNDSAMAISAGGIFPGGGKCPVIGRPVGAFNLPAAERLSERASNQRSGQLPARGRHTRTHTVLSHRLLNGQALKQSRNDRRVAFCAVPLHGSSSFVAYRSRLTGDGQEFTV